MYKMYIKEELQNNLIWMLVAIGQQKSYTFYRVMGHVGIMTWSIKRYLHVNVGYVLLSHLVAYSIKVELTDSKNMF